MRHVIRGFFVTALLAGVAGCGTVGYDGPNLYAYKDGYVDKAPIRPGQVWEGLPCYPRAPYILAGLAGPMGPGGPAGSAGPAGPAGTAGPAWNQRAPGTDGTRRTGGRPRTAWLAPV